MSKKTIADAPQYRGASARGCSACAYYKWIDGAPKGVCEKFEFETSGDYVCDVWEVREPEPMMVEIMDAEKSVVAFGDAIKATQDGKLTGYLVRFTKAGDYDLTLDRFDADTDFGDAEKYPVLYNHGLDTKIGKRRIGTATVKRDDVGLWVEAQLNLRDEYERQVHALASAGKMSWSSGSASHAVERAVEGKGAYIKQWYIAEASLTPTPAEPRNTVVALKSLIKNVESEKPGAQAEGGQATVAGAVKTETTLTITQVPKLGEIKMSDELKAIVDKQAETLTAQAATIAEQDKQIKSLQGEIGKVVDALKKEPPTASGVRVNPDDKYPYKSFKKNSRGQIEDATGYGEFLQDIVSANTGTRSVTPRLANWTDLNTKALKAASGLNASTPSEGGFFVQTDHADELVRMMVDSDDIISRLRKLPLASNADGVTINGVDETSRATTIWGGILAYWLAEADAPTASKPKFREIKLETKGLGALYYATDKLLRLAPTLGAEVSNGFREAMAFKVVDAVINGNGAGKPLGILNSGSIVSITKETGQSAATILHENVSKMKARMFPSAFKSAVWLANPDTQPQWDQLAFTIGTAGVLSPYVQYDAEGVLRVYGKPVVFTEHCQTLGTTGDLYLWDPASYYFVDLGAASEASSIHVAFTTFDTCFRFGYYCDGQPKLASALTPAHGTNTLTTHVKLDTRS